MTVPRPVFVIDASAVAMALLSRSQEATSLRRLLVTGICHAPHLIDAEAGNVLRRRVLRGELAAKDAEALLCTIESLIDHRHQMTGALAAAAWALRHNVTFYDGLYVALATALAAPLVTADARLAGAPQLGCRVQMVGAS